MNAATSEPMKFSPSPMPTTSGELRRAATTRLGSSASTATRVNAPSSRWHNVRIASVRSPPATSAFSSRWAAISVSVSESSSSPDASTSDRRVAKFSMMPLCTSATRPVAPRWGWALASVGAPWVAQRVCPIPVVDGGSGSSASAFSRLASLPARLRHAMPAVGDQGDPGGVVAAVLQPPQALDDDVLRLLVADVPHDAAHGPESIGPPGGDPGHARRGPVLEQCPPCPTVCREASRPRTSSSTGPRGPSWASTSTSRCRPRRSPGCAAWATSSTSRRSSRSTSRSRGCSACGSRRPDACTASRRSSSTGPSRRGRRS